MTIWFTSDNHYGHANVIRYSKRPWPAEDPRMMEEAMIDLHNARVKPGDTVWFLGDFAFLPPDRICNVLDRLNGQKHLVLGNHDKTIRKKPALFMGPRRFVTIQPYARIKPERRFVVLHHYGQRVWERSHHGAWHLFGHSHGSLPPHGLSVDVGVDSPWITGKAEYRPFALDEIAAFMADRRPAFVDHHGPRDQDD